MAPSKARSGRVIPPPKYARRDSPVHLPTPVDPSKFIVIQESLTPAQLSKILLQFLNAYPATGPNAVKLVTQMVQGSMISLSITPTKASDD